MEKINLQLEAILNNIMGGVIVCDYDGMTQSSSVVYLNDGWMRLTGYTLEELNREKAGNPQALIFPEDKERTDEEYRRQQAKRATYELMYRIVHRDGSTRWVIDKGIVTMMPEGILRNQSIVTEVTAIKEQEERLRLLSQMDQLTDLNNKMTASLSAQTVLERQRERHHALLLFDIDNFKAINDSKGHAFGDKVLVAVATRLKELFRSRDVLGRIGGDEFMVLMTDIPNEEIVERKALEICQSISHFQISGTEHVPVTVSIGGAFFTGTEDYEELFDAADNALYQAKNNGKNQCVLERRI